MNNDLIERYIYAVTKYLPRKNKDDIKEELTGLISDMLDERCGDLPPTEKDVRVVLTELGSPTDLAAKYSPDKDCSLIGPPYYTQFKRIAAIVLICVFAGITIGLGLDFAFSGEKIIWVAALSEWLATVFSALFQAFGILTLIFAIFQRKGVSFKDNSLDNLPPVPKKQEVIPKWNAVVGIVLGVLFGIIFTVAPQVCCAVSVDSEGVVASFPIFDTAEIHRMWYIVIAFSLIGIGKSLMQLFEGRYTMRMMWVTIVSNLLSGILTVIFFGRPSIMSPEFFGGMFELFGKEGQFIVDFFKNFHCFFIAVILFALILDTITVVCRTLKYAEK